METDLLKFANNIANESIGLSEDIIAELIEKNKSLKDQNSLFRISLERLNDDEATLSRQRIMNLAIGVELDSTRKDADFRDSARYLHTDEEGNMVRCITKFKKDLEFWYDFPIDIKIEIQSEEEYLKRKRFRDPNSDFVKSRSMEKYKEMLPFLISGIENE